MAEKFEILLVEDYVAGATLFLHDLSRQGRDVGAVQFPCAGVFVGLPIVTLPTKLILLTPPITSSLPGIATFSEAVPSVI